MRDTRNNNSSAPLYRVLPALAIAIVIAGPAWADGSGYEIVPRPDLTPGEAASTDIADICSRDGGSYSQRHRLSQNEQTKREVLSRYRVPWEERARFEDDHNLPLCAGGTDAVSNRWPQPRFGEWNAARKDELEGAACRAICAGKVSLTEAQGWFLAPADWRTAYCAEIGGPPCPP